jgi:hypothetical protein
MFGKIHLPEARMAAQPGEHAPLRARHAECRRAPVKGAADRVAGLANLDQGLIHGAQIIR